MIRADLHIHTFYSDGSQSPEEVVAGAKRYGVKLISVTDHDNACAAKSVKELASKAGIASVDGEEISAYDGDIKVHLLAYGADFDGERFAAFNKELYDGADARTFDILKKLSAFGVNVSYGEVIRERKSKRSPLHAMHIAIAGTRKGYASSPFDFYARYLNYGKVGFSCVGRPSPEQACRVVAECGGICSLAHPGRIEMSKEGVISLIERLLPQGLRGIEAVYSGHTAIQTQYYKEIAERYKLFITGGSDTHRAEGNRVIGTPVFYPDEKLYSALKLN